MATILTRGIWVNLTRGAFANTWYGEQQQWNEDHIKEYSSFLDCIVGRDDYCRYDVFV